MISPRTAIRTKLAKSARRRAAVVGLFALSVAANAQESWVVRADAVYTAAGDVFEGGSVGVANGKIVAVGPGSGSGDSVFEAAAVTPGLVDLSVRIDTGMHSVEQSDETPIELSVGDAWDPWSHLFGRELSSGVTTAMLAPQDFAVLGGLCTVVKTGGPLEARTVKDRAVLRASMGSQPSAFNAPPRGTPPLNFYFRRPTTRMGVEWVFRDAFYDAKAGVGAEDPRQAERNDLLRQAMAGELPVAVQAWATQDVRTAAYLKEEFGIPSMFVDAAAEAWREPELLVRSGLGVVLPPWTFDGRVGDNAFYALETAAKLQALGVQVALSGHGHSDPQFRLARQPGYAMRGGMTFDDALAAATIVPARMAGVDDRVGSIEVGKDADLVLWNGKPFEPTSKIIGVFLDGVLVVDHRPTDE